MSETVRVEASGETVGDAKASALRELEAIAPGLASDAVAYEVLEEGKRGLLGIGFEPARVAASVAVSRSSSPARRDESADAIRLRELVTRVCASLGVSCRIEISESDELLCATCLGDDLGRLIGRHGQTLDALQLIAGAILQGGEADRLVVVDAAGYRDRRRRRLEDLALRGAEEAVRRGERVALEPMPAAERKLVHTFLEHRAGVATSSEGTEPHRYVVVEPT